MNDKSHCEKSHWQEICQEGEFSYHEKNEWRQTDAFLEQTEKLFRHFGFTPEQYAGKTVLDLGSGSKLRTSFFRDAKIIAIEPLADRFLREISWCDLDTSHKYFSVPAEDLVDECVGVADLVISINVLDHCYGFDSIIANIASYLSPDGLGFLSFDKHFEADDMHPLSLDEELCESSFSKHGLKVIKVTKGFGDALEEDTYGHGPYALNYWLRKNHDE